MNETIVREILDTKKRLDNIETQDVQTYGNFSTANISTPPTDAQIDAAFDTPANLGAGFLGIIDDNGAGTAVYIVVSDGTNWWYQSLTKAT